VVGSTSTSYDANLNIFGKPMAPAVQAKYTQGQEIEVEVVLTAHHLGHFEFSACPIAPGGIANADCFKQYPLEFVSDPLYGAPKDATYPNRAYIAPTGIATVDNSGPVPGQFYRFVLKLPDTLSGDLVLLQWYYVTANSCKLDGYTNYPFPANWGNMQNDVPICGSIPPDGNGFPGKLKCKSVHGC
jgi:Lytic polysaccharide mono-oxygenase, cellulose-degrading